MDIIDQAQRVTSLHLDYAVKRARGAVGTRPSRETCVYCDEPIPKARQKAMPGCQLCIACQEEMEQEMDK